MAKRQDIPDILGQLRQPVNVLDDVLSGKPVGAGLQATEIRIADIRRDGATQPRSGLDAQHVEDLIQALTDGATLPAIDVMFDGTFYWLFDGYHRTEAHERLGRTKIFANVHQGEQADAQWASYAANKAHGLKRSNEDKKRQVLAALRHAKAPTFSNREIARHIGVDEGTIRYYRTQMESTAEIPQSTTRTGADGRTINTAKIGSNQPRRTTLDSSVPAAHVVPSEPTISLDELEVVDSVTVRVDDGGKLMMDWDDDDWAAYRRKLETRQAANVVPSEATHSRQQGAELAKCSVCNRPLSDPASAIAGVGPCCAAKRTTAAGSGDAALDVLAPDRNEASSAAQKRNERIESVLRRLYAARGAASEFEELTGIYTHRPAFERVMDAMIGTLEANRL